MINFKSSKGKFFEVTAKCGHVGRNKFYMGTFFIRAQNASEAAAKCRVIPRVKHHHKDAILSVKEIGYAEFSDGVAQSLDNPYFACHSKREQNLFIAEISNLIYTETNFEKNYKRDYADRQSKMEVLRRQYRKMNKYGISYIGA